MLKLNFLFDLEKLIEYLTSAVKVIFSNASFGPIPGMIISFFIINMDR